MINQLAKDITIRTMQKLASLSGMEKNAGLFDQISGQMADQMAATRRAAATEKLIDASTGGLGLAGLSGLKYLLH